MTKRMLICLLFLLALLPLSKAGAREWVVEEESDFPDSMAQARYLTRNMTLEDKIAQLFLVDPEALTGEEYTLSVDENEILSHYTVGGIVFFGQNIASAEQFLALVSSFQHAAESQGMIPLFLAMNQESGALSTLESKLGYEQPLSAAELGETGDSAAAQKTGKELAERMQTFGLNLNFAPVADVLVEQSSSLANRSFGDQASVVSEMALAMAEGLRAGGVIPCFKHFPGQGGTIGTAEDGRERSNRTLEQIYETELVPFTNAIAEDAEMMMLSSAVIRAIDSSLPATLSPAVATDLLRNQLGFQGVIVSASLRTPTISNDYDAGEAAVLALIAGADVLLLPKQLDAAIQGVQQAVAQGRLTEARIDESVIRILSLKMQAGLIQ